MRDVPDPQIPGSEPLTLRDAIAQWPSPAAVLSGRDHVFAAASEAYVRLVGGRELIGRPFTEALPELSRQGYAARLDGVFRTGVADRGEHVPVRWDRDGSGLDVERFVDFLYHPLRDSAGQVHGVLVEVNDVTARVRAENAREEALHESEALALQLQEQAIELEQQAEEARTLAAELEGTVSALRASEEQFRTLADSIPHLAWMANADGSVLWYNRRWYEYTGATWDEMRGTGWRAVHDPAEMPRVLAGFLTATAAGEAWEDTFPMRAADGEYRWFLSRAVPVRDERGRAVRWLGTNTDVTEQRRMEEEHRRLVESAQAARADAETANRAKSQFLATMSHEIRTPINAIIGYAELLEIGVAGPLTPSQTEYLERVKVSSRHLLGLVNDVLDLSKLDAGGMTAVAERSSLAAAAADARALVAPQAEARRIRLSEGDGCDADAVYVGDPDRVRQIVVNLLSNAVKFTEAGGRITVRCRATSAEGPGPGDWVVLEVEDTGIGIPPEQLARVFDPFVQVDASHTRTRGGTGLGLAISRDLARLMGGELTASSTPGVGSVFALWLPAPSASRPAVRARGEAPDVLAAWAFGPREVPGLAEVGHVIASHAENVVMRFGERVAADPGTPGARHLDRAHRENHFATTTLEIGKALIALDEGGGEPALLGDVADIQRTVAERHGRQRLRHGWSADEIRRETQILWEEIRDLVRREVPPHDGAQTEAALDLVYRLLQRAERIALASHAAWNEAGASP